MARCNNEIPDGFKPIIVERGNLTLFSVNMVGRNMAHAPPIGCDGHTPAAGGGMDMKLLYIDLFCGAGGTSTGVENARYMGEQCAKVIACVNHDANAIASHAANHPDALHFTEDIRTLELSTLIAHVSKMRHQYPDALVVLWASLECTNFSKAKGGQPRDAGSRTLAEHLFRYIEAINPDYIQIENVEEFMSWGDLDANGKPISKDAGRLYRKWVTNVCGYGYQFDHRILNSADYGAYTSRRRFFGIFARPFLPVVWPSRTHSKTGGGTLFGSLEKWKPVKEVLDFSDKGESIFCRKKPLAEKTLERIYAGLIKFVAGGKDAFIDKWKDINLPCPTLLTKDRLSPVTPFIMNYYSGGGQLGSVETPCPAIMTVPKQNLITPVISEMPPYLVETKGGTGIQVSQKDSPMTVKIKEFMVLYGIIDIKMRMLRISELKRIMGFPSGYILVGTQAEQKKFIGNAVEVNMARVLCEAICKERL